MSSQKQSGGGGGGRDERFRRVQQDPRFWEMPDSEHRVKIDRRFQAMFTEQRFQTKQTVDKRGRPVQHTAKEDLRRFYNLPEEEEDEEEEHQQQEEEEQPEGKSEGKIGARREEKHGDDNEEEELEGDSDEEEEEDDEEESGLDSGSEDSGPDLARGVGNVETSSDEDEEEEDEVEAILRREEEEIEHDWGNLCKDAPRRDEVSSRVAVCNLDWDRLKAPDLLALFNSFKPQGGVVLSVKIYPSEFGRERLQQEQSQGPLELLVNLPEDPEKDSEEERVHREKLRDYQFKRLRYFFAVVECDSADTASKLYEECDGFEYESSSSIMDLRFIPDDMVFDEEPRDVATEVELSAYTPKIFTSSAASSSKVEVTWDETDHERVTALSRSFNKSDLLEMDFNAYLASSSEEEQEEEQQEGTGDKLAGEQSEQPPGEEEEEEEEEDTRSRRKNKKKRGEEQISRYRELLNGLQQKESQQRADKEMEMEVSWVPGLRETTERLVKQKMEEKPEQRTPWEDFLQKKRERRKQKKSQEEKEEEEDDDDVPSDVDFNDPYFAEELGSAAAAGGRKKPKKTKKKKEEEEEEEDEEEVEKRKAEMSLLMEDEEDEKHQHFNFEKIVEQQNLSKNKRKKLQKKQEDLQEDNFQVDVSDSRFQALFSSHLFNLDPSHPSYQPTKGTRTILAEKQRRRAQQETHHSKKQEVQTTEQQEVEVVGGAKKKKDLDPSLSLLVKSIKSKTQQFQSRKKQRLM